MSNANGKRPAMIASLGREGGGFAVEGPGFYVWDEDRGQALRAACELQGSAIGNFDSQCTLRATGAKLRSAAGDSEALDR